MTTNQIIQEMEKELVKKARRTDDLMDYEDYYEIPVDKFHSYTRKLIEAVAEEICPEWIDNPYGEVTYYSVGRRDERKAIRLKVKEIISSIGK